VTTDPHERPHERTADLGYARVDVDRAARTGDPEVVYGEGKTPEQVVGILRTLHERHPDRAVLATRLSPEARAQVITELPGAVVHDVARAVTLGPVPTARGLVAVISAGTSDAPVAAEAALTATVHGAGVTRIEDVGSPACTGCSRPATGSRGRTVSSWWPAWRARCRVWSAA